MWLAVNHAAILSGLLAYLLCMIASNVVIAFIPCAINWPMVAVLPTPVSRLLSCWFCAVVTAVRSVCKAVTKFASISCATNFAASAGCAVNCCKNLSAVVSNAPSFPFAGGRKLSPKPGSVSAMAAAVRVMFWMSSRRRPAKFPCWCSDPASALLWRCPSW